MASQRKKKNDKGVSPLKLLGNLPKLPCKKHGHPGMLSPRLKAWWDFFMVILPYSTPQTLNFELMGRFCDYYGIEFVEAFEKLTIILRIVNEHDKRTGKSKA
jgi:hypothetical protein